MKVKGETIARTVVTLLALINSVLVMMGKNVLHGQRTKYIWLAQRFLLLRLQSGLGGRTIPLHLWRLKLTNIRMT